MDCIHWLLLISLVLCFQVSKGLKQNVEIVYPERLHHRRSRRDLSTVLKDKAHEDTLLVKIGTKQGDLILDLKRRDPIFPRTVLVRSYDANNNPKNDQITPQNCHFHGQVRNQKDSEVYITTCHDALLGTIQSNNGRYDIEPHDEDGAHKYYRVDDEVEDLINRLSKKSLVEVVLNGKREAPSEDFVIRTGDQASKSVEEYELVDVEEIYRPYLTTNNTRYIEMLISVDDKISGKYNHDETVILERILNTVGQVDKAYSAINIRLVVVALEVQTNGPAFNRSNNGGTDVGNFRKHFENLLKQDGFKDIRIDNAQLFSDHAWEGYVIGMAYVGNMCDGATSCGINWWPYSLSGPVTTLGHELGHNLYFPHDWQPPNCKCLTSRGCFMGGARSSRPGFSNCSLSYLAKKPFTCMNDYPLNALTSKCGNGIKEKDEECDCGTPEMCERNDPCCKPFDCKLKEEAQCNFVNNPLCCDKKCQFKKQGTMCRESISNCDTPEYCTGVAPTCPEDRVRVAGTPCGESKKLVLGTDRSKKTSRELTPRITAQYFKIIPKYWIKKRKACMSIEMVGCSTSADASSLPTSINIPNLYYHLPMCFLPNIESCKNVPDDIPLMYQTAAGNDCNHPHMMFLLYADGTLVHQCSKKKVCLNAKKHLRISSKCVPEDSIFERTPGWSLRHKRTGYCVVSTETWPRSGHFAMVKENSCDKESDRTKMIMRNIDCKIPLGFESGKLPNSSFSAGPMQIGKTLDDIRLGGKVWCPLTETDGSWFQINFGKMVEVTSIVMAGAYYDWVTGFYIMYSDNGARWHYYKEAGAKNATEENSVCYKGECTLTYDHQCQQLWSAGTKSASKKCWNNLNMNVSNEYGTCDPATIKACAPSDVMCGQIQCSAPEKTPYYEDYGDKYKKIMVDDEECSAAKIVGTNDEVGLGMVADGTKCDVGKICVNQKCKSPKEHGLKICPSSNGEICDGKGFCLDDGTCSCESGYDPETNCTTLAVAIDGKWSAWSNWSSCSKACGTGKHKRHRFCNSPAAKHGGKTCAGKRVEEGDCNQEPCTVGRSCKDIKRKMELDGKHVMDGVYKIKPTDALTLNVWCDMTRDGGGWTLVVSSHTNTWSPENVRLRNVDSPALYDDYSIFQYGNELKDSYLIPGGMFQYRIEADAFGKWGGIWEAPMAYDAASTNPDQQDVKLVTKFSDWEYASNGHGITSRLPYIEGQRIKVGKTTTEWGSMTDNSDGAHPSFWINDNKKMTQPEHVWYWLREGDYLNPKSCLDLMFRGFDHNNLVNSGEYEIEPKPGVVVKTYCDFDRHGGGWSLVMKTSNTGGWNQYNVLNRNWNGDISKEYSIFGLYQSLHGSDVGEASYNYMIEADGNDKNGGIFEMPKQKCSKSELKPTLVKKFGDWDENIEKIAKYPLKVNLGVIGVDESIDSNFASAALVRRNDEISGILISPRNYGVYMTSCRKPKSIKVWVREGGSRKSCNDLRIHGYHHGKNDYRDGFYMMKDSLPVYCDMTTTPKEGWTLLVTSASKGWNKEQVKHRNIYRPSLYENYSILDRADSIKLASNGNHFKYMLSAQKKRHWGGIWKAPMKYSFVSTSSKNVDVELVQQFDQWKYDVWHSTVCKRMPWLETSPNNHKALLTTSYSSTYYEWGSIVSDNSGYNPSSWISPEMRSPDVIWYWLDENDCDTNFTKVDGIYSVSTWSSCSVFCGGDGVQVRRRLCINPAPSCGGDPCDASLKLVEERPCNVPCNATRILTQDGKYCFEPTSKGCDADDGNPVILRPTSTHCRGDESLFIFNPNKGTLSHPCSKKQVCFKKVITDANLVVDSNCPDPTDKAHIIYTMFQTFYIGTQSFHAQGGTYNIVLWPQQMGDVRHMFNFSNKLVGQGPVKSLFWKDAKNTFFSSDPRFPSSPTYSGYTYNMETPERIDEKYAMQISSFFIPPMTGDYIFKAACDDMCQVYLSEKLNVSPEDLIIDLASYTSSYQWNKFSTQQSKIIRLTVGMRYYIEARLIESYGGDHMQIGVVLPSGKFVAPITSEYLAKNLG